MSTPSWIKNILTGGLPAALDVGISPNANTIMPRQDVGRTFVERNPPQDIQSQTTVNQTQGAGLGAVISPDTLKIGIGIIGAIGLLLIARKLL